MKHLFHPELITKFSGFWYRFRFLCTYIVIGFISIVLELTLQYQLIYLGINLYFAVAISLTTGIIFAFVGNFWFNFKIPSVRRNQAFIYFVIISLFSSFLQWLVSNLLHDAPWNYEQGRLLIAGSLFMIAYVLHRRYSFRNFKRVGVAIYANGVEDLKTIHANIGQYPDFIHVDIVDNSFSSDAIETSIYRMETIRAFWPNKEVHTHIMSMNPSRWLPEVLPYSDLIYVHWECEESLDQILKTIHSANVLAGLALTMKTKPDKVRAVLENADAVLLLTIPEPGKSGQKFDLDGLERIEQLNQMSFRKKIRICIDGGVNERIAPMLHVEDIVSGSSVLNNINSKLQILRLQTSGRYESI